MRVSETLGLNIPDKGLNVEKLEQYLAKEIWRSSGSGYLEQLMSICGRENIAVPKGPGFNRKVPKLA